MKHFLFLIFFCVQVAVICQPADIKEVEIVGAKTKPVATKIVTVDSLILKYYKNNSLADLLQEQTGVFVKNYGGAGISTISLRGSNASQTPVLWQGFNIQNRMLGQTDMAPLPGFLFDAVSVQYTPNSGSFGNGHIGGAIILDNTRNKNIRNKNSYEGCFSYGSFKSPGILAKYIYNGTKIQAQAKLSSLYQENNYSFLNESLPDKPIQKLTHAQMIGLNGMIDLYYNNKKSVFDCHYWYQNVQRNIPPTLLEDKSVAEQFDESHRVAMSYQFSFPKMKLIVRNGLFSDKLNYTDSITEIYARHIAYTEELDVSVRKSVNESSSFELGTNGTLNLLRSNFYINNSIIRSRGSLYLLFTNSFFRNTVTLSNNIRIEGISFYKNTPVIGSVGAKIKITNKAFIAFLSSSNFRYPTFNDLYWQPGGNPNLKPEYSSNNEMTWSQAIDSLHNYTFEVTGYYKEITNYIQWVPTSQGYWVPQNALRVAISGGEFNFKGVTKYRKTLIKLHLNYGYTHAINKEVYQANSNSLQKQLMYVPPHKLNLSSYLLLKNMMVMYTMNFIGYRYITSDNSAYLEGFVLHNLKAGYDMKIKNKACNISGSVNNVLNKNYLVVAARPMPRRSFMFAFNFYL